MNTAATPPITSDDVRQAVALAADTLLASVDRDWHTPAGTLGWDCWETVEHMADDLFAYAAQLGPRKPPQDTHVPFAWQRKYEGAPAITTFADPEAGNAGLIEMFEACGAFLAAMVATAPPETRAHHVMGLADPEGFAAMGVVEVVVHMHDVAAGLHIAWTPPEDLCDRVLYRLFPDAPADTDTDADTDTGRWPTLLWVTGRGEIPGRERITGAWRWYAAPRA